jgi:hypothetical protein
MTTTEDRTEDPKASRQHERTGRKSFTLGQDVTCNDGPCGQLRSVVVDPVERTVSHLVVHTWTEGRTGHLVPVGLADAAAGVLQLRCSRSELHDLPEAQERDYLLGDEESWPDAPIGPGSEPYYWGVTAGSPGLGGLRARTGPVAVTRNALPAGELELHRGEPVRAADGDMGELSGLVLDADDRVTHLLVASGPLFGRTHAAVPVARVARLDGDITIDLSWDAIRKLPPVTLKTSA